MTRAYQPGDQVVFQYGDSEHLGTVVGYLTDNADGGILGFRVAGYYTDSGNMEVVEVENADVVEFTENDIRALDPLTMRLLRREVLTGQRVRVVTDMGDVHTGQLIKWDADIIELRLIPRHTTLGSKPVYELLSCPTIHVLGVFPTPITY